MRREYIDREMYYCTCEMCGIMLLRWTDDLDQEVSLSMWGYRPEETSIGNRLRGIWRIITRGHDSEDDVILSRADMLRLGLKLIELSYAESWSAGNIAQELEKQ